MMIEALSAAAMVKVPTVAVPASIRVVVVPE
jgi:hypothetical protein